MSLQALWEATLGTTLEQTLLGKPNLVQYTYVEQMLREQAAARGEGAESIERFYMVGDNPETDIRGAREAGPRWRSFLTRTGVWVGEHNDGENPADVVVPDVLHAVQHAMDHHGVEWDYAHRHSVAKPKPGPESVVLR